MDSAIHAQLVEALLEMPDVDEYGTRMALLVGIPRHALTRSSTNTYTDISLLVDQLANIYLQTGEWALLKFIDNAIRRVDGTNIASTLLDLRRLLASPQAPTAHPSPSIEELSSLGKSQVVTADGKDKTKQFDTFLSYHWEDRNAVVEVGEALKKRGILPWLDAWQLRPGLPWQREIERQIRTIPSAVVLVGKSGMGPWHLSEIDAFLREFKRRGCPVIPVLLADAPQRPDLPVFLEEMTWVDFRKHDPDPLKELIWGITGQRELPNHNPT